MKIGGFVWGVLLVLVFALLTFMMTGFCRDESTKSGKNVQALLRKITKVLTAKYPVQPCGTSVAMPEGDVRVLGIHFDVCGPLTKAELRTLLVDCAHVFLEEVNADEKVRPHLNHHPFGAGDLDICFFIKDVMHKGLRNPNIGIADLTKGRLSYWILEDKEGKVTPTIPVVKSKEIESYAEALDAMKREEEGPA